VLIYFKKGINRMDRIDRIRKNLQIDSLVH
jgi:hypothetical protein